MNKLSHLASQSSFRLVTVLIGAVLCGWPFLTPPEPDGSEALFLYGVWAVLIVMLALIARALSRRDPKGGASGPAERPHV